MPISHRMSASSLTVRTLSALVLSGCAVSVYAMSPQEQYRKDVADCNAGRTHQSKQVCLQEAGAALGEARKNNLTDPGNYQQTAQQRCMRLPAENRAACEAQMAGQGKTYGSVEGGGVLREMTVQVPVGTPGSTTSTPGYAPAPGVAPVPMQPGQVAPAPMPAPRQPGQMRQSPMPPNAQPGQMRPAPMPAQNQPGQMRPAPMPSQSGQMAPAPMQQGTMPAPAPMPATTPGVRY